MAVLILGLLPVLCGAPAWLSAAGLSVFPAAGIVYVTPAPPVSWWAVCCALPGVAGLLLAGLVRSADHSDGAKVRRQRIRLRAAGIVLMILSVAGTYVLTGAWWDVMLAMAWLGQVTAAVATLAGAVWAIVARMLMKGDYLSYALVITASGITAALLAVLHSHHPGHSPHQWVPATAVLILAGAVGAVAVRASVDTRRARRRGAERDSYLAEVARSIEAPPSARTATSAIPVSLQASAVTDRPSENLKADERDRQKLAEWIEALALQPESEWKAWGPWGDEYLLPAMRYRIWASSVALSMLQYLHTPAFSGRRTIAGRKLIDRYTAPPVWAYWPQENFWGNLRRNPDPIATPHNIMYSGYMMLATAMYARATNDPKAFNTSKDALRFRWDDDTVFTHTRSALAERVAANFRRTNMCLWDCEPGLTFPMCNAVGLAGLTMHDTVTATDHAAAITPTFLKRLFTEFVSPDGDIHSFQASRLGMANKQRAITNSTQLAALLSPIAPDFAYRTWHLLVHEEIDTGRYLNIHESASKAPTDKDWGGGENRSNALGWGMSLARERGDDRRYRLLRSAASGLESQDDETRQPFISSVNANGVLAMGLLGRQGGWRSMMLERPKSSSGPRLADADHPDVTVVTAVTDGRNGHDAVLYPGKGTSIGRRALVFDQLTPGQRYTLHGAAPGREVLTADQDGKAQAEVDVEGRTVIRLRAN